MPLRVGLTGGVASGKSTVAERFSALGVPVLDADVVAHELLAEDEAVRQAVAERFGPGVLDPQGRPDRARLRQRVFSDTEALRWLETLLHPRIRARMERWAEEQQGPYCILSIPLLIEAGWQDLVDRILVVDAPAQTRKARLMQRPGMDETTAEAIMSVQMDDALRRTRADDLIDNGGDLDGLRSRVEHLHRHYLELATTSG